MLTKETLRRRARTTFAVLATLGVTFAIFKLVTGDIFPAVLVFSAVVGVLLLATESNPRTARTTIGAGLLTFAAVSSWWPLVEGLIQR